MRVPSLNPSMNLEETQTLCPMDLSIHGRKGGVETKKNEVVHSGREDVLDILSYFVLYLELKEVLEKRSN